MLNLWCKRQRLLPFLALLLGTQACFNQKDFDPELVAGLKSNPSVAVPLIYGSLSLEDLLSQNTSQYVDEDKDKLIHLIYRDTLYSTSIRDHFLLHALSVEKIYFTGAKTIVAGNSEPLVEERSFLRFDFDDADFDEIRLKNGSLSLSASSNIKEDVQLELTFPTLSKQDQPLVAALTIPASENGNPQTLQLNLQDYNIDLSEYPAGENLVPVDIVASVTASQGNLVLSPADYIEFDLDIENLDYNLILGHLGQREVSLPQGEMDIDFFETIFSKARFSLKNPILRLDFLNSNGVPVQVKTETLQVRNRAGEILAITTEPADPIDLNYPTEFGQTAVTSVAITNIGEVIDFVPAFMDYKLSGKLNVGQPQSLTNFVTDSSSADVVLYADIPLWGSLEGFSLSDTLAMTLQPEDAGAGENGNGGYTIKDANASIHAVISNQFPLGGEVQVYFTNAQYEVTDSLFSMGSLTIKPSNVNAEGDLQSAEVTTEDPLFSDKQLERMLESSFMIVKANMYTTRKADGTQPHVKVKSNYRLDVNLGLKANMNIVVKK